MTRSALKIELCAQFRVVFAYPGEDKPSPQSVLQYCIDDGRFVRYHWVPQTLGDQVWIWVEFESSTILKNFTESLPLEIAQFLESCFTQKDLDYWSEVGSMNCREDITKRILEKRINAKN